MDQAQSLSSDSNTSQGKESHNPDDHMQYELLYKALRGGDLDATNKFLIECPEAVRAKFTVRGETALQIAIMFGHVHIMEELVQLMSADDLQILNDEGFTALHCAATSPNNIEVAKCMVQKNKKLVVIPSEDGDWIPVTLARSYGNTEMARYLYHVTPLEVLLPENGVHGVKLLKDCYYFKMLDVALDLLKRCPKLAVTPENGRTFLETLTTVPLPILNENQLPFWQRWIFKWVKVHQEPSSSINEIPVNIPETNTRKNGYMMRTSPALGFSHQLLSNTLNLLGVNNIYEAKIAQKQSLELLRAACNLISTLKGEELKKAGVYSSIVQAAERGIPEFIVEAVKVRVSLLWTDCGQDSSIFHLAVQFRQAKVFNLIHGVISKERFPIFVDERNNTLLHMTGLLAPSTYLNHISGAVLQMQRELQWFKEVESIMPPPMKEFLNVDGMTPRELFTKNHKDLVKEGERWTKETASSCTVVAALVATITFAAAFTLPGGNDENTGYPIFLQKKLFALFIISNAVSLFSSSTSVLMFLGLLTSRYAEDDFLTSLPTKLITGLSTLFISIATMMIAFCAALFLVLRDKPWISIPVALLACVPVTLYIWLQSPLLVEIFMSTYRSGIFDRNVKPWP